MRISEALCALFFHPKVVKSVYFLWNYLKNSETLKKRARYRISSI